MIFSATPRERVCGFSCQRPWPSLHRVPVRIVQVIEANGRFFESAHEVRHIRIDLDAEVREFRGLGVHHSAAAMRRFLSMSFSFGGDKDDGLDLVQGGQ